MNTAVRIRLLRLSSTSLFILLFLTLGYAFHLAISEPRPDQPTQLPPGELNRLQQEITVKEKQLDAAQEEHARQQQALADLRRQYDDEVAINNALREDLKKASAKLRQATKKPKNTPGPQTPHWSSPASRIRASKTLSSCAADTTATPAVPC